MLSLRCPAFAAECCIHGRNALDFECTAFGASVPTSADESNISGTPRTCHCKQVVPSPEGVPVCVSAERGYGWAVAQLSGTNSSVRVVENGYDQVLQAPFFTFTTGSTSQYQVWYENAQSLSKVNKCLALTHTGVLEISLVILITLLIEFDHHFFLNVLRFGCVACGACCDGRVCVIRLTG